MLFWTSSIKLVYLAFGSLNASTDVQLARVTIKSTAGFAYQVPLITFQFPLPNLADFCWHNFLRYYGTFFTASQHSRWISFSVFVPINTTVRNRRSVPSCLFFDAGVHCNADWIIAHLWTAGKTIKHLIFAINLHKNYNNSLTMKPWEK